jgi:hypothetical protein
VTYRRFVSLKNHDRDTVRDVEVRWEPVADEYLRGVELAPGGPIDLGKGKPGRYTVLIHVSEGWATAGPEAAIEVRLYIVGGQGEPVEATLVVRNRCQGGPPDEGVDEEGGRGKPPKPPKPDNPGRGNKPDKPGKP